MRSDTNSYAVLTPESHLKVTKWPTRNPAIYTPQDVDPNEPFKGDLFGRKAVAASLEQLIECLPYGGVYAIDAPWGDGKTWFASHWAKSLVANGFRVIQIDAFKSDYIEDPFVLVAAELIEGLRAASPEGAGKLSEASKRVSKALLPIAAKVLVGAAGRILVGSADLADEVKEAIDDAKGGLESAAEKAVERRLDDYAKDKASIEHFREQLRKVALESDKPIVVLIDELDRCRPTFAVQMLERIKHFFDVPRVVFVLFINQSQLIASVQGLYGTSIDAQAYLRKFLQFTLSLPKARLLQENRERSFSRIFCDATLRLYGFPPGNANDAFADVLSLASDFLGLALRDIERGIVLFH